ncbi:MAG: NAD-dependent epimerase/dehydratase family protein [Actinomycetota bacterium]
MKVFVAGATGVIGTRAVAQLIGAGHEVTAIARTPEKAARLRSLGARPVSASLFDAGELRAVIVGHDAVVNLATKIPTTTRALKARAWAENERIRIEGSAAIVDAALAAGARVYVQESIAFLYGDQGANVIDAATTPLVDSPFSASVRAAEANTARFAESGGRGVVLRFGMFWAADSVHTEMFFEAARRGMHFDALPRDGYFPMIDADDAASAVVAALDAPTGTYDIVEDEPLPRREVARALARAVARSRVTRPPAPGVSRVAPHLKWSQRVSNRRFREVTNWRPAARDGREIVAKGATEMEVEPALPRGVRLFLWYLVGVGLMLGVYAEFFPRAFYDDFPFGRQWVAHDGAYNEHLIRDFGAMNLALAAVAMCALAFASLAVARTAAIAWLVFSVPHALYHLRNLEHYETADQWGNVLTLSFGIVLAAELLRRTFAPARLPTVVDLRDDESREPELTRTLRD